MYQSKRVPGARAACASWLIGEWWHSAQGQQGNDAIVVDGNMNILRVCPASAHPTALDLVFVRRAARATTTCTRGATTTISTFAPRLPSHRSRPRFLPQGGPDDDTLTATGTVSLLSGGDGAGDSCTLDGVKKTDSDGSTYSGCE